MSANIPVSWRRPETRWLEPGGIYPSGEPPFDPFPKVSDIIATSFCPVAGFQRLLHGITDSPELITAREIRGAGDLYHRFIAYIKSSVVGGQLRDLNLGRIRQEFLSFARGVRARHEIWRRCLEPWCRRKLKELNSITPTQRIFFEVTVASERVPFRYDGTRRTYPLLGRIDEIDLDRQLIIERTIVGGPDDQSPPRSDEMQLWLLWKILTSIEHSRLPREIEDVELSNFRLIVETPFKDFEVNKQNSDFERESLLAYAWIRDFAHDPWSVSRAYANRRCDREPGVECSFMYRYRGCRRRLFRYPLARARMQREFRDWYRLLFWELMWKYDFFQYKLLRFSVDDLEREGLVARARVVSFPCQNTIMLEVIRERETGAVLAHIEDTGVCELIFGTPSMGQRVEARPLPTSEIGGNGVILRVDGSYIPMTTTTLILPEITMLESRPWFLTKLTQQLVFSFEQIGREVPDRAMEDPYVQLIESLFGSRVLRRERPDVHS